MREDARGRPEDEGRFVFRSRPPTFAVQLQLSPHLPDATRENRFVPLCEVQVRAPPPAHESSVDAAREDHKPAREAEQVENPPRPVSPDASRNLPRGYLKLAAPSSRVPGQYV